MNICWLPSAESASAGNSAASTNTTNQSRSFSGGRAPAGYIRDGETAANLARAPGAPTPPPTQLGHFHDGTSEFWFMLEGSAEFLIEGEPLVRASQGDVVYVPPGRWHRSGHVGDIATRVSTHPIAAAANVLQPGGGGGE